MTQLEFYREHDERAIAHLQASEPTTIPGVGDRAFVPDEQHAWDYVSIQVAERRFYYDRHGQLTTVKLSCNVLLDDADVKPHQADSTPKTAGELDHREKAEQSILVFYCPRCACPMTIHQPDPELEECLLATCEYCKSWYLTNPGASTLSPIRQLNYRPSRQ
jgi:hypothetical protein